MELRYFQIYFLAILVIPFGSSVILRHPSFKIPWKKLFPPWGPHPQPSPSPVTQVSPVIFIPGDGGSQLEAKLNKPSVVHYLCAQKSTNFFDLWLNIELLLPYVLDCWVDNMRLVYNNVTKKTENSPGVDIRVVGFGNSSSVEYLDPSQISVSKYFVDVANLLVRNGYKRDVSIRGAPYDFRKAPNEMLDFMLDLQKLVEEAYKQNNDTAVTLIGHSMGNMVGLQLLHLMTPEWKNKYIKAFITLAAPFAGAVKALKVVASGDNLNVALVSAFRIRAEQRTNPSIMALFPHPDFWDPKLDFVQTPERNYSLSNLEDFFFDMNFMDGWETYKRSANLVPIKPPGVPVYCLYGVGVDTPLKMIYGRGQFPDTTPKVIYGDGDGTVNRASSEVCGLWQKLQSQPVEIFPFKGVTHMTVLNDKDVLATISKIMFGLRETK